MCRQENQSVKSTKASYFIERDRDLPEYNCLYVIVQNCPYCYRSHSHGPTPFLRGQEDPNTVIQNLQGTQRMADCHKGEYILNLSKTLPQD